ILACELEVPERRLRRVELRRGFQRELEFPLRLAKIAGLEKPPAALLAGDGRRVTAERFGDRRLDEVLKSRGGLVGERNRLAGAGARGDRKREDYSFHSPRLYL